MQQSLHYVLAIHKKFRCAESALATRRPLATWGVLIDSHCTS